MQKQQNDIIMDKEEEEGIELAELLSMLFYNIKTIIISTIAVGLVAFLISAFVITPMYTAGVSIYVNNAKKINTERIESADITASQLLVNTYVTIIQSNTILKMVAKEVDNVYIAPEIRGMMSATAVKSTEIFKVNIENADPKMAARIANEIAEAAVQQIPEYIEGSSVKIIDYATVPKVPSSPNILLNIAIGLMMGFIISILLIFVSKMLDTRIKSENDLENMFALPILGKISNFLQKDSDSTYAYTCKRSKKTIAETERIKNGGN